ncbi:MAG TPA: hypothetical protein VFB06_13955 [Streptosporangiaceae bacterium]|nr:hypothetical protein [Streptosporangiaceae bacterium]
MGSRQQVSHSEGTAPRRNSPARLTVVAAIRQRAITVAASAVVVLAIAVVTANVISHGSASGQSAGTGPSARTGHSAGAPHRAATESGTLVRAAAAEWLARQLSASAVVACDPQMCSALRAAGLQASRRLLRPSAADPLGATIVVATRAVRDQFGPRLASVYAPEVIASFGSGPDRIEVRYVAPGGARSFAASQVADRGARVAAGQQLLRNQRIHTSTAARAALATGSVDPRLLVTLAALAAQPAVAQQQVSVVAFGGSSPGAAGIPLRDAEIASGSQAGVQAMLSFLLAQQPPYQPAEARLVRQPDGQYAVNVQFDAPSPLGLNG